MKDSNSPYLSEIRCAVTDFLSSENRILILSGMFGQCMGGIVRLVEGTALDAGVVPTVVAPAARISKQYCNESKSVYGLLYDNLPHYDRNEQIFVHGELINSDGTNQLYLIGDSHLISDSPMVTDSRRFGSGSLLNDLMDFINLNESERRIIFIGDPYQVLRGSSSEMALNRTKLKDYSTLVQLKILESFECNKGKTLFLENRKLLADRICNRQFQRLKISLNDTDCTQLSDLPSERDRLIKNRDAIVVAYTHEQVNNYNQEIRSAVFGRGLELEEGDLVVSCNHITINCKRCAKNHNIPSGSFGVVRSILAKESIEQPLKGRSYPIKVNFLKACIRWNDSDCDHDHEQLCLEDFLYTDKPELGKDKLIALVVHARNLKKIREEGERDQRIACLAQALALKACQEKPRLSKDEWNECIQKQFAGETGLGEDAWIGLLVQLRGNSRQESNLNGNEWITPLAQILAQKKNHEESKLKEEKWVDLIAQALTQKENQEKPEQCKDEWIARVAQALAHVKTRKEYLDSPYLNAARLRFGYSITLHRAQGCLFETVVADLASGKGMGGEAYFRWLYTAFSVPYGSTHLINVPRKGPFNKTVWSLDQSQLDYSIRPNNLIGYDLSVPDHADEIPEFPTIHKELRNLFGYISRRVERIGAKVSELVHHNYLEVYTFEADSKSSCVLQFHYNGKFQVTRISVKKSQPSDFASQIQDVLISSPVFYDTFQEEIYDAISKKLEPYGIRITAVDHHKFQEVYFVEATTGKAKLRAYYNKVAAVTKVILESHSSEDIRDKLKSILDS